MLDVLERAEGELPRLLLDLDSWNSLYIDYEQPYVDRLWRPFRDGRLFLHRIHPCNADQALFHPHPWPSAMRIVQGRYEMAVGFGSGETRPPIACRLTTETGLRYEMTDPDVWHYVRPLSDVCWTVMVTGLPWGRPAPKSTTPLRPLTITQVFELVTFFRSRFPVPL